MKYLVSLTANTPLARIPWAGASAYTAWVYRALNAIDPTLGNTVHRFGVHAPTDIRDFAISPIQFEDGEASPDGFLPHTPFATLTLGTFDQQIATAFEKGAFATPLVLGPMTFSVLHVMAYPDPEWEPYHPLSVSCYPVALRGIRNLRPYPAFPRDSEWLSLLAKNLAHKARQFCQSAVDAQNITITVPNGWQARYQQPYGFPVPAFRPRSELRITAPTPVYDALFTLGFGVLNSSGMGVLTTETLTRLTGLVDLVEA